jgi:hypothetical protein
MTKHKITKDARSYALHPDRTFPGSATVNDRRAGRLGKTRLKNHSSDTKLGSGEALNVGCSESQFLLMAKLALCIPVANTGRLSFYRSVPRSPEVARPP